MRIVYFGSGSFGLPTLRRLAGEHHVVLVVTQPDRPAGRRQRVTATPVGEFARRRGLEVITPQDVNEAQAVARIRDARAGAMVVIAYGQKIGPSILQDATAINLHASLLPRYRGAAPISWAIINGEAETGLSVIAITQRIDAGDVLGQVVTPIDPMETAGELEARLAELGPDLMCNVLSRIESATVASRPQEERLACPAPKLSSADGTVSFDQPAARVRQRVHGLTPRPGCTVVLDGKELRLTRVSEENGASAHRNADAQPGRLLADGTVACADGAVRLLAVQPAGGRPMSFEAYLRGHPIEPGARIQPR